MSLDLTLLRSVQLCKHICGLCVSLWLVIVIPYIVEAQRRGVSLTGTVTEIVALTIAPNSSHSDIDLNTVSTGSSVRLTLSGAGVKSPVIRVRLLVRSNTGFNISGILESNTVLLTQLWVIDVRATGKLVSGKLLRTSRYRRTSICEAERTQRRPRGLRTLRKSLPFSMFHTPSFC